ENNLLETISSIIVSKSLSKLTAIFATGIMPPLHTSIILYKFYTINARNILKLPTPFYMMFK
ncbi:MAG: hypothetical protein KAI81_08055, partial [Candidatus Marinimicrobia bacterium]|nr:hypothetical protein [Candidatus Neomarinimicrobiota bacterium]